MSDPHDASAHPVADGGVSEEFERCAACGATIPADEWCPVVTDTDADGNLVIRSFCDRECKNAWTER